MRTAQQQIRQLQNMYVKRCLNCRGVSGVRYLKREKGITYRQMA